MGVIGAVLIVLFVVVSILLAALVLIQDEQGDSMGGIFGGSSTSAFGATSSSVLGRITRIFGGSFIVLSLLVAFFLKSPSDDGVLSESQKLEANTEWWTDEVILPDSDQGSELIISE